MKKVLFAYLILLCAGCGGGRAVVHNTANPSEGGAALKIAHAWLPENMMQFSAAHRSGLHGRQIFYLQNLAESIVIKMNEPDGTPLRDIVLPKGKGPGEVIYTVGLRFIGDSIYFMDTALGRVTVFDVSGAYVDDYTMNEETGRIWKFDIVGGDMYFNSFSRNKNICRFDLANGVITAQRGESIAVPPEDKDPFEGGCIEAYAPDGRVYYAYESYPFRIEEYDCELTLLRTISRRDSGKKPMEWTVGPQWVDRQGDVAVTSMKVDEKYLYVSNNGANYDNSGGGGLERVDASLSVFDRRTGKYIKELYVDALRKKPQYVSIVGVDREYIVMTSLSAGEEDVFEGLGLGMISENGALVFIVAENPMYGD